MQMWQKLEEFWPFSIIAEVGRQNHGNQASLAAKLAHISATEYVMFIGFLMTLLAAV